MTDRAPSESLVDEKQSLAITDVISPKETFPGADNTIPGEKPGIEEAKAVESESEPFKKTILEDIDDKDGQTTISYKEHDETVTIIPQEDLFKVQHDIKFEEKEESVKEAKKEADPSTTILPSIVTDLVEESVTETRIENDKSANNKVIEISTDLPWSETQKQFSDSQLKEEHWSTKVPTETEIPTIISEASSSSIRPIERNTEPNILVSEIIEPETERATDSIIPISKLTENLLENEPTEQITEALLIEEETEDKDAIKDENILPHIYVTEGYFDIEDIETSTVNVIQSTKISSIRVPEHKAEDKDAVTENLDQSYFETSMKPIDQAVDEALPTETAINEVQETERNLEITTTTPELLNTDEVNEEKVEIESTEQPTTEPSFRLQPVESTVASTQIYEAVTEKVTEEKVAEEKVVEEKITEEKISDEKISEEKVTEENVTEDKFPEEKLPEEKLPEEKVTEKQVLEELTTVSTFEDTTKSAYLETDNKEDVIKEEEIQPEVTTEFVEPTTLLSAIITSSDTSKNNIEESTDNIFVTEVVEEATKEVTSEPSVTTEKTEVSKIKDSSPELSEPTENVIPETSTLISEPTIQIIESDKIAETTPRIADVPQTIAYVSESAALEESTSQQPISQFTESEFEISTARIKPAGIPGEGNCLVDGQSYANNSAIPPVNSCQLNCICISSIVQCELLKCPDPPAYFSRCTLIKQNVGACCPIYVCDPLPEVTLESGNHQIDKNNEISSESTSELSDKILEVTSPSQTIDLSTEGLPATSSAISDSSASEDKITQTVITEDQKTFAPEIQNEVTEDYRSSVSPITAEAGSSEMNKFDSSTSEQPEIEHIGSSSAYSESSTSENEIVPHVAHPTDNLVESTSFHQEESSSLGTPSEFEVSSQEPTKNIEDIIEEVTEIIQKLTTRNYDPSTIQTSSLHPFEPENEIIPSKDHSTDVSHFTEESTVADLVQTIENTQLASNTSELENVFQKPSLKVNDTQALLTTEEEKFDSPASSTASVQEEVSLSTFEATSQISVSAEENLVTSSTYSSIPSSHPEHPQPSEEVLPSENYEGDPPTVAEEQDTDEVVAAPEHDTATTADESSFGINSGTILDPDQDYAEEDQAAYGPGTCRYGGKIYMSAQQIPRDDPCDFCFCFRSDIICLQQSCPPPIPSCHEEPISGFCCPRYECPVSMAATLNLTTTTTTTTTLPPHFPSHVYKDLARRGGCQIQGQTYEVGEEIKSASGPCMHCT